MTEYRPVVAVWELTAACNARCAHCGSSSGRARPEELDVEEALALCEELKRLGCREVSLIGGEPLMSPLLEPVTRRFLELEVRVGILTNGSLLPRRLELIRQMGLKRIAVSLDGLRETHDSLRGMPGLFATIEESVAMARRSDMLVGVNTTAFPGNIKELVALHELLANWGVAVWQIQMVELMGEAAKNANMILSMPQVSELVEFIADARLNPLGPKVLTGDNIGWFSRRDTQIRDEPFRGCRAGRWIVGIESDGGIKACQSLPSRPENIAGNIRERSLTDIWHDPASFRFSRDKGIEGLAGACAVCDYRRLCRGGCSSAAYTLTGAFRENPACLHAFEVSEGVR